MTNTDGNLYALEKHLAEREDDDARLDLEELIEAYKSDAEVAQAKLEKAIEALRFYAIRSHWFATPPHEDAPADVDCGDTARSVLAELTPEGNPE